MKYISLFLEYLRVSKKYSINTINSYYEDLVELSNVIDDFILVSEEDVKLYLNYLYERKFNKNTISRKLSSVRAFYNYLYNNNFISVNYFSSVHNPHRYRSLPHFLKPSELDKMFEVPDVNTPLGQRNLLILEMLYATGVRVSELVNIKIKDIDKYSDSIKILGKGNKERIVYYGSFCKNILNKYISSGRVILDTKKSEYLFLNKFGNKLSDRMIRNILDDLTFKSGIDKHTYPHMIRHTFATDMLNSGADLMTVKELLGHESIDTTSIYTHVTDGQIRKIYDSCHPRAKE